MAPDKRRGSSKKPGAPLPADTVETDGPSEWTVEVWEDDHGRAPFVQWFERLDQYEQAVVDAVIEQVLVPLGIDVCSTEWGKALGNGLYEVRIRRPLSAVRTWGGGGGGLAPGPGSEWDGERHEVPHDDGHHRDMADRTVLLRIFVTFHGSRVVLLFQGYDKGADASEKRQQREIRTARKHLRAWREQRHSQRAVGASVLARRPR